MHVLLSSFDLKPRVQDTLSCFSGASRLPLLVVSLAEKFQEEERKLCKCPTPCNRNLYDPIVTYAGNSHFDMNEMLQGNADLQELETRYHSAREVGQKVNPQLLREDR